MSSTNLTGLNSTSNPLDANQIFLGGYEFAGSFLTVIVNVFADTDVSIQTFEALTGSGGQIPLETYVVPKNIVKDIQIKLNFPYFLIRVTNLEAVDQTKLNINTIYTNLLPLGAEVVIGGDVTIAGVVTTTPELLSAQLRSMPLVVGHWYSVASDGDTPGAVWNEMGAIVGGESEPPIGRQFQCLYPGYGTGTCFDITAPVNSTATANVNVTNLPIVDSGHPCVAVSVDAWTAGTSVPIVIDTDGNTIQISQTGTQNQVQLTGSLPSGSNTIGVVGLDSGLNTIKTDPTANSITTNPTAVLAVRTQGLSNTALQIYAASIIYGNSMINKSAVVSCWVKFYSKATAPTAADIPFMIQYLENVVQYNLISHNDSFYNMPISDGLWVRATLTSADNDTTDTGIDCEVTTFLGAV